MFGSENADVIFVWANQNSSVSNCLPAGQATVCLVGGTDELSDISNCEFANMTATASADGDKFAGRFRMEISRPMSATHSLP